MIIITDKKNCTGCYACLNICPRECIIMESDSEGFWYPKVDMTLCVDCGLCDKVCPILHKEEIQNEPQAYACYNKDDSIRMESSSGGVFTLIAEQVIDNNGVVFGSGFAKGFLVVHKCVETKEGLGELRGSKYVQSKIEYAYKKVKDILEQVRPVLFVGTSCQIGGLKAFLQRDYANLFCIDIICHGVPSPKVWQKYVAYREDCAGSMARKITFRRKDEGWKRYSVSFQFKNDTEYLQNHQRDLYMQAFLRNTCLRPSCHACNFKTLHRKSDITLADFWGIQKVLPDMDDDKGTSLVFVNSIRGKEMFDRIKELIIFREVDIHKAVSYNSSAIKSDRKNPNRDKFFKDIDKLPFDKLFKRYCSYSVSLKCKKFIRRGLSKIKRTLIK